MDASPQSVGSETTILGLNDDCLQEVFDWLNIEDLTAVADVCARFRQNAARAARSKINRLELHPKSSIQKYSMLRNFGMFIESLSVSSDNLVKTHSKYPNRIIEQLNRYCVKEPMNLELREFGMTSEIAVLMQPLLGRVQSIQFLRCHIGETILTNLPFWSPDLRKLEFQQSRMPNIDDGMQIERLHQTSSKLESIYFSNTRSHGNVDNRIVERFLKQSPHLKKFSVHHCDNFDDGIFNLIAEFVPAIERLTFATSEPTNRSNAKHFSRLRELKSLKLRFSVDDLYIPLILHELVPVNTNLKFLELSKFDLRDNAQQFIEDIAKLKQLESLEMRNVQNMRASHLIAMCKPLKELTAIILDAINLQFTQNDLLNLLQNAEKLETLHLDGCTLREQTDFDVRTFDKWLKIVERRREKNKLQLYLDEEYAHIVLPGFNISEDLFKIKIVKNYDDYDGYDDYDDFDDYDHCDNDHDY